MHPIERLRYVARAEGAGVVHLVEAAASALAGLAGLPEDEASLVTGCRQMVDRHPAVGPLWFLSSRMLCSSDPGHEAWAVIEEIEGDEAPRVLAGELPQDAVVLVLGWPELIAGALHRRGDLRVRVIDVAGEGFELASSLADVGTDATDVPQSGIGAAAADADIVVLEALAAGPTGLICVNGSRAAAAVAHHGGRSVWAVVGHGRLLPDRLWDALLGRLEARGDPWDAEDEFVPFDLVDVVVGPWGTGPFEEALGHTACPVAAELFKGVYAPGTFTVPVDAPPSRSTSTRSTSTRSTSTRSHDAVGDGRRHRRRR